MTEEVSIRMKDDDGIAPPAFIFAPRPDKKGPKTIAILLIMGSLIMISVGWGDIQNSMRDDFPEEGNDIISNFDNNDEVNVTIEEYQEFHDEIRDNGYYTIRGYSLTIGGGLLIVGGVMLFRLNAIGAKLSITGAIIGLIGGLSSSWLMAQTSMDIFQEEVAMIFKVWSYLCGFCMVICLAMAALPVLNASARAALSPNVVLVNEEE